MSHPAKPYRIVSDGTSIGTHIYDPQGNKLALVTELKIHIDTGAVRAQITQLKKEVLSRQHDLTPVELDVKIPASKMSTKKEFLQAKKKTPLDKSLLPC